eukprot:TRINITY_DN5492_c0_g1_i1.p1 TRINITY_DN5492_c0_g1~~TRINITY_DN5492_c0_g1_i1.p1  ORF type:complete len:720 (-),score=161.38 TRINITY_DN5492_c0_g1_i1:926-3085(-)
MAVLKLILRSGKCISVANSGLARHCAAFHGLHNYSNQHNINAAIPYRYYSADAARNTANRKRGPDRILPANKVCGTMPDTTVEIRFSDLHPECQKDPISVWTMLQDTLKRCPDRTALSVMRNNELQTWTFKEYEEDIRSAAKAFIKLGLKRYHGVALLGFNAPEWHISCVAGIVAGGLSAGIYTTNSVDATRYVAEHSRANIMVVEDEEQLAKIEAVYDRLPELQTVIQYTGYPRSPGVLSWQKVMEIGRSLPDSILTERLEAQAVNQPCALIYTSGTTGNPKGVMLSHDNITWTVRQSKLLYGWRLDAESMVSYLPLSHVAGMFIDIFLAIYGGATVNFADKLALQGTLLKTLVEAKPTLFFGVPRVYEKIQEKMMEVAKQNTGVKKSVAEWAKASCSAHHEAVMAGQSGSSLSYTIASNTVMKAVKKKLGFERTTGFYSSAAPLSEDVFRYFCSLDMPIQELLGSSETSGPQTASYPGHMRVAMVGKCYPSWEIKIDKPDEHGIGEICTRGRNCCIGYLWDEQKTTELIDSEGWVHSGDLGTFDSDGFLKVGGRSKEIIVTAGGENVAPIPIEDAIKAEMKEIISNVMVVGDKRKHLAAIVTLRTQMDEKNQPTDLLHPDVKEWVEENGSEATTVTELLEEDNEDVRLDVLEGIQKVNRRAISNAQKVHKFMIAPSDFSLAGGELTPTMKMKRHFIEDKYKKKIDEMYEHETQSSMW